MTITIKIEGSVGSGTASTIAILHQWLKQEGWIVEPTKDGRFLSAERPNFEPEFERSMPRGLEK